MSGMLKCVSALVVFGMLLAVPVLGAVPRAVVPPIVPPTDFFPQWPMLHYNSQRTGQSASNTSRSVPHIKWSFDTGGPLGDRSPVIGSDGTVYITTSSKKLLAINPDGKKKWEHAFPNETSTTPAIDLAGVIYVPTSSDRTLYAIKPDGTQKWAVAPHSYLGSAPLVGPDGTIYIVDTVGFAMAIYPNGTEKWSVAVGDYSQGSPARGPDGSLYVSKSGGGLSAITPQGELAWKTNYAVGGLDPSVDSEGVIYNGKATSLVAVHPDGTKKWSFDAAGPSPNAPSIGTDGTIYFGANNGTFYAVRRDNTLEWTFKTGDRIESSAAIGSEGTLYFGSNDGKLYALLKDGSLKWSLELGAWIRSSPAIARDGTVYVGCDDGKLYAVGPEFGAPSAPGQLESRAGPGFVSLTWQPPASDGNATLSGHSVYRAAVTGPIFPLYVLLKNVTGVLAYNDTGVTNGIQYKYYVTARNAYGESPASATASALPRAPPTAPLNLTATADDRRITLSWAPPEDDGGANVTNYRIYKAQTRLLMLAFLVEVGSVKTFTDAAVTNGVTYQYAVSAVNAAGEGARTKTVSVEMIDPPSAPQNLSVKAGDKKATLSWSAPADDGGGNVTGYRIYRGLSGANLTFLVEVGNVLNYTDTGLSNGKTYTYRITAKNSAGESATFANATAKPKAPASAGSPGFEAVLLVAAIFAMAVLVRRPGKKD